jgi:hypothetical protein
MQEDQLAKFPTKMADCQPKTNFPELMTTAVLLLVNVPQNSAASMRLRLPLLALEQGNSEVGAYRSRKGPQLALTPAEEVQQLVATMGSGSGLREPIPEIAKVIYWSGIRICDCEVVSNTQLWGYKWTLVHF